MGIGPAGLGVLQTSGNAVAIPLLDLWTTVRKLTLTVAGIALARSVAGGRTHDTRRPLSGILAGEDQAVGGRCVAAAERLRRQHDVHGWRCCPDVPETIRGVPERAHRFERLGHARAHQAPFVGAVALAV